MLKPDLILQIMSYIARYLKEQIKKVIGLMKDEIGRKMMKKHVGIRAKTYSQLVDDDSEDKKAKNTKKFVMKRRFKFENYKNYLEATQLENKINHLEKKNCYRSY